MTDITELAQSLKAAAEKATPGQWERGDGKHGGELLVYCDDALGSAVCEATSEYNAIPKYQRIDNLDFIALANPANILALVEALEKAQRRIAELENYAEAEAVGADRAAEDSVYWMKRCKELESRTVKLPHRNLGHPKLFLLCPFPYYDAEDMEKALAAAGIKVEVE
ncbi:ead/Ea22-like family protein [Klebsiella quasipneumoniae]|uniref:ead/Ea22-like family protein n=1 Tax=Klebsiella quasipneumoniae TaxID=1463165 RepID=UPI002731309E|nr:ead/Ea22-like family protein [Klebsiella quasipneumoniae]MDP1297908.1 ead/Ea22-like family protein [Klebsiella quasipneumoniae]